MGFVQVIIDESSNIVHTGQHEWDREAGGILIPGSGSSFPASPVAKEWFWRTDQNQLYRRNDANDEWEAVSGDGDVQGPGSATDNALVRFDGTTGKIIQQATSNPPTMDDNGRIQGTYTYAPSSTDPSSSPTPAAGDRYFNTSLGEWMFYDGSRSKWLSQSLITLQAGRNGLVPSPGQLQGIGSMNSGPGRGLAVPKSTLVYVGIHRSDSDASELQLGNNDSSLHTVTISAAQFTEETDTNIDFAAGSVQFRISPSQNEVENIQVTMLFRRRV